MEQQQDNANTWKKESYATSKREAKCLTARRARKASPSAYGSAQSLPCAYSITISFIFLLKWVTSIYNTDSFVKKCKRVLALFTIVRYNKDVNFEKKGY